MALNNRYVVLYFIRGPVPSMNQVDEARQYGPHVMFRNALFHRDGEGCEPCTAYAGDAPSDYASQYPKAVSYSAWLAGELRTVPKPATPGEVALGQDTRPLASRIIPAGAPTRPPRSQRKAPAEGTEPLSELMGTDGAPPPPPPPRAPTTGSIMLPPPPPQG